MSEETAVRKYSQTLLCRPVLYGVDGWLLFLCLSLVLLRPLGVFITVLQEVKLFSSPKHYVRGYREFLLMEISVRSAVALFGLVAGIELWSVRPKALLLARLYLVVLAFQTLSFFMLPLILGMPAEVNAAIWKWQIKELLGVALYFSLWLAYLAKSERVANTFAFSS